MSEYQLAQMNVGIARDAMDSEVMKGFADRLDEMNTLAEQSPGFVWRLVDDESGDATSIQAFENPNMIVNMSVWQDIASLKHYVYQTVHVEMLKDKKLWFEKMAESHQVLWWVPKGHTPTIEEGKQRLQLIQQNGASAEAFNFARPFEAPSTEQRDAVSV